LRYRKVTEGRKKGIRMNVEFVERDKQTKKPILNFDEISLLRKREINLVEKTF
jgi:hypothetical protein